MPEGDQQLHPLLIGDELVHVHRLRVDLELLLDLQILCQVELLWGVLRGLTWGRRGEGRGPQEEEEHVQIDHMDHIHILDGALTWPRGQLLDFLSTFGLFVSRC